MGVKQQLVVDNRTVTLTNLEKELYPAIHFTKAQVIDYYARVSEWILPHLKNRPVTLKRFPDGVGGQAFYEKDAPRFTPEWVTIAPVPRRGGAKGGKDIRYVVINDRPTLIWCANIASLELHPFLHVADALDTPTSLVFDLDPGPGMNVVDCGKVAFELRERLARLGLQSFVKLSGSKGIQLYAPLNTPVSYSQTQPFARSMAERMAREHPDRIVFDMAKNLRPGKIFIDWSQNSDFKTTVGVYSLRAKSERPFVSAPITWEELDEIVRKKDPDRLCLEPAAVLARFEKLGDLFEPVLTLKQPLPASLDAPAPASLELYGKKRNFSKTAEPAPSKAVKKTDAARRFVIQKHAASHLHYDFRLEMHDVLKSWAVPKGVPYTTGERRLAMATEDHPMAYIDFEGTIPKGQYGGGTVMVWDAGTYELIDGNYYKGKLHFRLHGKKLKGEWVLVKGRSEEREKNSWYLLKSGEDARPLPAKKEDSSAVTGRSMEQIASANDAQWHSNRTDIPGIDLDALPNADMRFVEPMQALLTGELPGGEHWQYEIKFDGYRALAVKYQGEAKLWSRRNNSLNARFPEIAAALNHLEGGIILDGEVTALDEKGRPSFNLLQNSKSSPHPIVYYVFDVLAWRGRSLLELPLKERRKVLETVLASAHDPIRLSGVLQGEPEHLIAAAREQGLEGLVGKRTDARYEPGRRSGAWVKYKIDKGQELVIGGYKPGANGFENLAVGYYEGEKLLFIAKLKNGFVPAVKAEIAARFKGLETDRCPFANLPEPRGARRGEALTTEAMKKYRWLKPELVAQVAFTDWTDANHLRHSRFIALRDDKPAREVVHEKPVTAAARG
jgi:bifunctional non-homologous end joining protein LigD